MKTAYDFSVDTFRTSSSAVTVTTDKASIEFHPDPDKGNQIQRASVIVEGNSSDDLQRVARLELIKAMTVYFGPQTVCSIHPSGWSEVPEEGSRKIRIGVGITISSNARIVAPFSASSKALKVRLNGDAKPVLQYSDASKREHPQDKYLQMFRIIEYLCGQTMPGQKMGEHIIDNLGVNWRIPKGALQKAMSLSRLGHIQNEKQLASELWDMRSRCAHFQPKYGIPSFDDTGNSEVVELLPIMDDIVRHSLEEHRSTREP